MARSGSCHSLPLALIALLLTLATFTSALPTARRNDQVASEPLYRRETGSLNNPLERLRLRARNSLNSRSSKLQSITVNGRTVLARSPAAVPDLKNAQNDKRSAALPIVSVWNPKVRRVMATPEPRRRNLLGLISDVVVGSGLMKRSLPVQNPKRLLARRDRVPRVEKRKAKVTKLGGVCTQTSDCGITLPDDSHQKCYHGKCAIGCNTGYELSDDGTECWEICDDDEPEPEPIKVAPTTKTSASSGATQPASKTCQKTADCNIILPDNAHQKCYRGTCTFGCNKNYAINDEGTGCEQTCTTPVPVKTTTAVITKPTKVVPTSVPTSCKRTSECNLDLPDDAHNQCYKGQCIIACNGHFKLVGSQCVRTAKGAPTRHVAPTSIPTIKTTTTSVKKTTTTVKKTTTTTTVKKTTTTAKPTTTTKSTSTTTSTKLTTTAPSSGPTTPAASVPKPTSTSTTTTSSKAPAASGLCAMTSDCNITLPDNAHQRCQQGKCVIACNKGHTLDASGPTCVPIAVATTTTTSSGPASTAGTPNWPTGKFVSSAYYPDWNGDLTPPSSVNMSLFDLIFFAFAVPTKNFDVQFEQWNSAALLTSLVQYAHGNNTKVVISIGGWTDSTYFSAAVSTVSNRAKFIANIANMVTTYGVDGVDIDWEYPGGGGVSSNIVSVSDTANYLLFLQGLRTALGTSKHISTCTTQAPFIDQWGNPLTDMSAFANVLDSILVMNYDVWGASPTPGPNAPLSNACPNSQQPTANEASAIAQWTGAGFPASKIIMGVPSYGYISSSTATTLINKRAVADASRSEHLMSNRELAAHAHTESSRSELHRWYLNGRKKAAKRQLAASLGQPENSLDKRAVAVAFCPGDHSGNPCGETNARNQTIKNIHWNPLNTTTSGNGTYYNGTTPGTGVFPGGGVGIGKLGNGDLGTIDGNQIEFYQLISYGVIVQNRNTLKYSGVNGYTNAWDNCSNTPYLYDQKRGVVITYDDPTSLALKGALAASSNIGGIGMWDINGDTADWQLVKGFRRGLGLAN